MQTVAGGARGVGATPHVQHPPSPRCSPMHNTPMYVEDPGAHGHAFWRSMAQEILYGLKPNPQHPPLYVIPDRAPQAATASAGNSHHSYQQSQPHQPQQQPQLQPQQLPAAAALAYVWRPDVGAFNMPATEAMLRAEAVPDWEACGELWCVWGKACSL
eukprot:XP_001696467.1 predicted protein [Chlamydomonas reinhardtii]